MYMLLAPSFAKHSGKGRRKIYVWNAAEDGGLRIKKYIKSKGSSFYEEPGKLKISEIIPCQRIRAHPQYLRTWGYYAGSR